MAFTLNVFTLNCWGIPGVSKNRRERFAAIGAYLLKSPHNIVCLQEVWSENDYLTLKNILKGNLPYSHYFYSGVLGSGLCIFSKWIMQDVFFHQWPLNGYIHKIHHGDWFGGKGIGFCRIQVGESLVNVYCTHLHAEYHQDDIYLAHRVLQAYSTAEFVNLTTAPADISILAGDLNTAPGDLSFKIVTQLPPLTDPYDEDLSLRDPEKSKSLGTSDSADNSYADPKQVKVCPEGKRIDHILYKLGPNWEVEVTDFGNPLPNRVPNQQFSYSDHNAVSVQLHVKPIENSVTNKKENVSWFRSNTDFDETATQAIQVCEEAMVNLSKFKTLCLTVGGLILIVLIGLVGYWPKSMFFDIIKICITGLCFYCLILGTIWHKIEMNSLKAGVSSLQNFCRMRIHQNNTPINK